MGVGTRIKNLSKFRGITLKELAESAGISYNTIYSITKRDSCRINPNIAKSIADSLDVSVDYLLNGSNTHILHLSGLHIYHNNYTFDGIDDSVLNDYENDSYKILYRNNNTIIIEDNNCKLSDEDKKNIVNLYSNKSLLLADEDDREFMALGLTLHPDYEELPHDLDALNTLMNLGGYQLSKMNGHYYFTGETGFFVIEEDKLRNILKDSVKYISLVWNKVDVDHVQKVVNEISSNPKQNN